MKRTRITAVRPKTLAQAGTGVVSLVLAEAFYKFHSFSLECLAFLATWAILYGAFAKTLPGSAR